MLCREFECIGRDGNQNRMNWNYPTRICVWGLILIGASCQSTNMPTVFPGERGVPNEGQQHVDVGTTVSYLSNPPASGPHYSATGIAPLPAGLYRESDGVRPEQWVHNLEHGYIVYLYACDAGCSDDFLNQLQALFDATPQSSFGNTKLVIAPYAGLQPFMMAVA